MALSQTKARRIMTEGHRSVGFKRLHHKRNLQDGDGNRRPIGYEVTHVGDLYRPVGRLLPHPNSPKIPEVFPGGSMGKGLPLGGYAHGSECCGSDLHKGHYGGLKDRKSERDRNTRVLRRLVGERLNRDVGEKSDYRSRRALPKVGPDSQLQEIGARARSGYPIFGGSFRLGQGVGHRSRTDSPGAGESYFGHLSFGGGLSQKLALPPRKDGGGHAPDSHGSSPQEAHPKVPFHGLVPGVSGLGALVSPYPMGEIANGVVAPQGAHLFGSSFSPVLPGSYALYGCQRGGFRGFPRGPGDVRSMVPWGSHVTLQQPRTSGGDSGGSGISEEAGRSAGAHLFGQCVDRGLDQQAGRNQVLVPRRVSVGVLGIDRQAGMYGSGQAYSGQAQRRGRCTQQVSTSDSFRVVDSATGVGADVGEMGHASNRLICNTQEPQVTQVRVPVSSPRSLADKCLQFLLDRAVPLRFSPLVGVRGSPAEAEGRSRRNDFDRTYMENQALVPLAPADVNRGSSANTVPGEVIDTASLRGGSPESSNPAASGVEIIRRSVINKGFSERVAVRVASNVRKSSLIVYNSKWRIFSAWCDERGVISASSMIKHIADFLEWLFTVKKLSVSTTGLPLSESLRNHQDQKLIRMVF